VRLNLQVDGPLDGAPVVFLHGVSGCLETYGWLPPEIVGGRRVVRVDLRGHGGSERATGTYRVSEYGADVVEVLRSEVGRPAVLVGHSLGGVVAWWIAQNHPDLVVAAFLEDPPLYMGEPAEHERNEAIPIFATLIEAAARWHEEGLSEQEVAAQLAASPTGPESTDDSLRSSAHGLLAMDPGVLEQAYDRSTLAETDTLSPVRVPLVLLAADDAMGAFPERHAARLRRTHPDVEIVRVDGAPHWIHDSRAYRAAYVSHLTRFLAAHADAG
jgi:pimeloyl-ACP methyl ester carboxylesterase